MLQRDLGKGILEGSGSLLHTGLPPSLLNGAETFPTALHTGSCRVLEGPSERWAPGLAPRLSPPPREAIPVKPEGTPDIPELTSYFNIKHV